MRAWKWWLVAGVLSAASGVAGVFAGHAENREYHARMWDDAIVAAKDTEKDGVPGIG